MNEETKAFLQEQFAQVDGKLVSLSDELSASEKKLATGQNDILTLIDRRFDAVEEQLSSTVNHVAGHEKRIAFLENKVLQ